MGDTVRVITLPNGRKLIRAGPEVAHPQPEFTLLHLATLAEVLVEVGDHELRMRAGQRLTIAPYGTPAVAAA